MILNVVRRDDPLYAGMRGTAGPMSSARHEEGQMPGSRRSRARATLLACVILGIGVGTAAQDPCYENVTVRSAGLDEANGRLTYWRILGLSLIHI